MRRRLLNLLTALSLAAFLFCMVSGVIGFRDRSELEWDLAVGRHSVRFVSDRGALMILASTGWPSAGWGRDPEGRRRAYSVVALPVTLTIRNAGVVELIHSREGLWDGQTTATVSFRGLRSNVIYAGLATLIVPGLWVALRFRTRRQARLGMCLNCGYDLRATPGRCPECGTAPAAPSVSLDGVST